VTYAGAPLPSCDPQDGVYLSFGHLGVARCSGPELVLYQRQAPVLKDGTRPIEVGRGAEAVLE
jgi:hypothetical protein